MPSATFELARALAGRDAIHVWIKLTVDGDVGLWSGQAIADPATYEDGYKEARLLRLDELSIALSDRLSGQLQATSFSFEVSDLPEWATPSLGARIRGWLGAGKTLRNADIECKFISDAQRRLGYTPAVAFRGLVEQYAGLPPFRMRFDCIGWMEPRLRQPVVTATIGDSWAAAPADTAVLPAPIALGRLSDAGSASASPTPTAEAVSGATAPGGPGNFNAVAGYGSLANGISVPTGGALTEELASGDFIIGDVLYLQYWKRVAGVDGDPDAASFAFASLGATVTIGADNSGIRATCTDDGDGATYCFAIGPLYAGRARYHQILTTTTPAVGVLFTRAPGAAGIPISNDTDITPGAALGDNAIWNYTQTATLIDGETVVSNSWIFINNPYLRPARLISIVVPGAISYTTYRGFLTVYDRKQLVPPTQLNGAGDLYFEDNFLNASAWTLATPPIERGQIPLIPVGPVTDLTGATWSLCFVYAAHACDISTPVTVFKVDGAGVVTPISPAQYGVDVAAPGQAGYTTAFGATPYWTTPDGKRWMIVAYRSADYQDFLDGTQQLRANVLGAEPVGDGSGACVENLYDQLALLVDNLQLLDEISVLGADWRTSPPTFPDTTEKRDTASWTLAQTNADAVLPEGHDGARYLTEPIAWADLLAEHFRSARILGGTNAAGQLQIVVPNPNEPPAGSVDHVLEIRDEAFQWRDDAQGFANAMPYAYRPTYDTYGASPALEEVAPLEDPYSQTRNKQRLPAASLSLVWRQRQVQAAAVARLALADGADLPRTVDLGSGIHWAQYRLGNVLEVTHPEGPKALGYVDDPIQILGLRMGLGELTVDATCVDRHTTPETDMAVGDMKYLSGDENARVLDTAYPAGAGGDKLHHGSNIANFDSATLAGTFVLEAMGAVLTAGMTLTLGLFNLTDAPDVAIAEIAFTATTPTRQRSGALTFGTAGSAKSYGVKAKVSAAGEGFGWGATILRTA